MYCGDWVIKICKLAYEKGTVIRWFFPSPNEGKILRNFLPVNSTCGVKMKKVKDDLLAFFQLAYLTSQNIHSLSFEYHIDGNPRILFTADSIINPNKAYDDAIITAPHHGAESNKIVYQNVRGNNLIWIRSDRHSSKRPCADFLALSDKYCLRCTKDSVSKREEEIEFHLLHNKWTKIKGINCRH